jgi:DNA-binding MarR family transcriptional regulator
MITCKGEEVITRITNNYTAYLEDLLKGFEPQNVEYIRDALEMLASAVQQKKPLRLADNTHKGVE